MTNKATHYGSTDYSSRVTICQHGACNCANASANRSILLLS